MSSRTRTRSGYQSSLNGSINNSVTSFNVTSGTGLVHPVYLAIDPDDPLLREIIKVGNVSGNALSAVTRGLTGSVAGAQAHATGAPIRAVIPQQFHDDVFNDIEALEAAGAAHYAGTDTSDHPEVTPSVRGFMSATDKTKLNALDTAKQVTGGDAHTHAGGGGGAILGVPRIGDIIMSGLATESGGYLLCNGQAVNRTTYATLFAAIGVAFGPGNGTTTFNLPDMRGRFPIGVAASGTGSVLGGTGGLIDHTHTQPTHTHTGPSHTHTGPSHIHTMGAHTHTTPSHTHTDSFAVGGTSAFSGSGPSEGIAGDDHAHTLSGSVSSSGSGTSGSTDPGDTGASGTAATGASGTAATGASGSDATGLNNPPFQAVHFFIRAL
jgi:microcystin-dependent protein